ncbi:MAG: glycosyltransferase family 2 protein [Chloroflexi bacterium]|nr:glycosyltransferase family 2 protein [Chloroflexota bacterium]
MGAKTLMDVPLVTVIMPVRNEESFIARSLGAVLTQDYPPDRLEILVVDGRSDDQTRSIVQALAENDSRVHLMDNPGRIQACALNIGIAAAQGEIIIRMDGHSIMTPDYVRQCVYFLHTSGAEVVGGPLRYIGITTAGRTIAAAYGSPFSIPSRFRVSRTAAYVDTIYPGAWRRDIFERVGMFDESFRVHEDYEMNYRIRRAGGRIYLTPEIRFDYYGRQTIQALGRQFFRYGRDKARMLARFPASARPRHLVAPAFVLALGTGALLSPFSSPIAPLWALVLGSYTLANGIASVRESRRAGWRMLPRLPVVFATMHLCWGIGFWVEAVQIVTQRGKNKHE